MVPAFPALIDGKTAEKMHRSDHEVQRIARHDIGRLIDGFGDEVYLQTPPDGQPMRGIRGGLLDGVEVTRQVVDGHAPSDPAVLAEQHKMIRNADFIEPGGGRGGDDLRHAVAAIGEG